MHMGIDQTRGHRPSFQVDSESVGPGESEHLVVRSHGCNSITSNRHGLSDAEIRIHGQDFPVVEDDVGGLLGQPQAYACCHDQCCNPNEVLRHCSPP